MCQKLILGDSSRRESSAKSTKMRFRVKPGIISKFLFVVWREPTFQLFRQNTFFGKIDFFSFTNEVVQNKNTKLLFLTLQNRQGRHQFPSCLTFTLSGFGVSNDATLIIKNWQFHRLFANIVF